MCEKKSLYNILVITYGATNACLSGCTVSLVICNVEFLQVSILLRKQQLESYLLHLLKSLFTYFNPSITVTVS